MITSLDPASESFLASLGRLEERLKETNRQVSSGKRVAEAADDPDRIGSLLQLRASLRHNLQVQSNLIRAQNQAAAADDAISRAIQLMDRALTIASQAANGTTTDVTRQNLLFEVEALQEEMRAFSGTTVAGAPIFPGDDLASCRQEDSTGSSFAVALSAAEVFDRTDTAGSPTADNVFSALTSLRDALAANDTGVLDSVMTSLRAGTTHLASVQAFYGGVQNRLADADSYANRHDVRLRAAISDIEDADLPAAIVEMTELTTAREAALQMRARLPHTSLFDFLG